MSELESQLIAQAAQDAAFRDRLVSDPKSVLAEQGLVIPDDIQVSVLQESPTQYFLVLPALGRAESGEAIVLSDQELEAVSGGATSPNWPDNCVSPSPSPAPWVYGNTDYHNEA